MTNWSLSRYWSQFLLFLTALPSFSSFVCARNLDLTFFFMLSFLRFGIPLVRNAFSLWEWLSTVVLILVFSSTTSLTPSHLKTLNRGVMSFWCMPLLAMLKPFLLLCWETNKIWPLLVVKSLLPRLRLGAHPREMSLASKPVPKRPSTLSRLFTPSLRMLWHRMPRTSPCKFALLLS